MRVSVREGSHTTYRLRGVTGTWECAHSRSHRSVGVNAVPTYTLLESGSVKGCNCDPAEKSHRILMTDTCPRVPRVQASSRTPVLSEVIIEKRCVIQEGCRVLNAADLLPSWCGWEYEIGALIRAGDVGPVGTQERCNIAKRSSSGTSRLCTGRTPNRVATREDRNFEKIRVTMRHRFGQYSSHRCSAFGHGSQAVVCDHCFAFLHSAVKGV